MKKSIFILTLLLLASCTQNITEKPGDINKTAEIEKPLKSSYGFTFVTPKDWSSVNRDGWAVISKNGLPKIEIQYLRVKDPKPQTCFTLTKDEEFREKYAKLLECSEVNINGIRYIKAKVLSTIEGKHYSLRLHGLLDDGTQVEAASVSLSEKDFSIFEEIIQSFKFELK